MFEQLVGLIDGIKKDSIGEWIVDRENDGTPEHPEYGLNRYGSIIIRHPPCFGRAFFHLYSLYHNGWIYAKIPK